MKKLAIMSDLHIDLNAFVEGDDHSYPDSTRKKVTHLYLAGDISNHHKRKRITTVRKALETLSTDNNIRMTKLP